MLRLFIFEPFESFDLAVENNVDTVRIEAGRFVVNPNKTGGDNDLIT